MRLVKFGFKNSSNPKQHDRVWIVFIVLGSIVVVIAIALGIYFGVKSKQQQRSGTATLPVVNVKGNMSAVKS